MKNKLIIIIILIIVGFYLDTSQIQAYPVSPFHAYGTVKINNLYPSSSVKVSALCGGIKYKEATTFIQYVNQSWYVMDVTGDDAESTLKEGCTTGETIVFKIDNCTTTQQIVWAANSKRVDLTCNIYTPTSTPDIIPPVLNITNPLNNSMVKKGSTIIISAQAYDLGSGISSVQFIAGSTKLCTLPGSALNTYDCKWLVPKTAGKYTVKVIAYDKTGIATTKSVNVMVK